MYAHLWLMQARGNIFGIVQEDGVRKLDACVVDGCLNDGDHAFSLHAEKHKGMV